MASEWQSTTLGEISTDVSYGYTESASNEKVGPHFLRITDIQNGVVNWNSVPYCYIKNKDLPKYLLEHGDIVVARTGNSTGENYLYSGNQDTVFASYLIRFKINKKIAHPKFVWYCMRSPNWWGFISSSKTGSAQAGANAKTLSLFPISIPDITIQKAIAHILGTLDDKIELNRQMNATLEAMAQALFKSWFVDFDPVIDNALAAGHEIPEPLQARAEARAALGDQRRPLPEAIQQQFPNRFVLHEEMGWVPEGWEVSTLGAEFDVTMGQSPPGHTYNTDSIGMPFFQGSTDFGFRYPSNRVYCTAPNRLAKKDETLVSVRAPVGDTNIAREDCCIGRGIAAVIHKEKSRSYTYYTMRNLESRLEVYQAEGTVFGSINQKDFKALRVINPKNATKLFHERTNKLDQKIEVNERQTISLTVLRNTLLPQLLSGQLRVAEAEQLIAEAL